MLCILQPSSFQIQFPLVTTTDDKKTNVQCVSDQKRTGIFERMMPNIVGKILIASRAPNADLKAPLESLGFVDVDRLFKHAKRTLHD
jgi:hypothetical protein